MFAQRLTAVHTHVLHQAQVDASSYRIFASGTYTDEGSQPPHPRPFLPKQEVNAVHKSQR